MTETQKNPEIAKLDDQITELERQRDRVDVILKEPRDKRFADRDDLYQTYWAAAAESAKPLCVMGCVGFMAAGALTAMMVASSVGIGGLSSLISLGTLVGTFTVVPRFIGKMARKFWLPGKTDKMVKKALQYERTTIERDLALAQARRKSLVNEITEKTLKDSRAEADAHKAQTPAEVMIEEEIINVDGVRLRKKTGKKAPA
jgi:hypothetical protein